jgi:hypothetical protein
MVNYGGSNVSYGWWRNSLLLGYTIELIVGLSSDILLHYRRLRGVWSSWIVCLSNVSNARELIVVDILGS